MKAYFASVRGEVIHLVINEKTKQFSHLIFIYDVELI